MSKRIPILLFVALLAGILMGLVTDSFAQERHRKSGDGFVSIWVADGGSFLGVYLEEIAAEDVDRLSLPGEYGVRLAKIIPDTPAAEAGLQQDDVILGWNGARVESVAQLRRLVRETPAGRTVRLGVFRAGSEIEVSVKLGKQSDYSSEFFADAFKYDPDEATGEAMWEAAERAREAIRERGWPYVAVFGRRGRMGVSLQRLTPQLADYFGLKDRSGALIASVRKGSPAEEAGLKAGDIILSIDGDAVQNPLDAMRSIARKEEGPVEVRILRDGRELSLRVTLERRKGSSSRFTPGSLDTHLDHSLLGPRPYIFVLPHIKRFEHFALPEIRLSPLQRRNARRRVI